MKKIITSFLTFLVWINSFAQEKPDTKKYIMAYLPAGTKNVVANIGVIHKDTIYDGDMAYTDIDIINEHFRMLSKIIDPEKVVLVVEYPETICNMGMITTDSASAIWITPEMRKMGFTKWMPADTRPRDANSYFRSMEYLNMVENKYFYITEKRDSIDYFGFPQIYLKQVEDIPKETEDSALKAIAIAAQDIFFEVNIKFICVKLRQEGYTPIVISGLVHTLALKEPCVIQVPISDAEDFIKKSLNEISGNHFMIRFLLKKRRLILIPK